MPIINRLTCVALFVASIGCLGAAQRSLVVDEPEVVIETKNEDGDVYKFEMSGDSVEITTPGGVKIEIEDGKVIEVIDGETEYDINEGRRLEDSTCETGLNSCLIGASAACGYLAAFCATQDSTSFIFQIACSDLTFCLPEAVQGGCDEVCPTPCNKDLNDPDNNTNPACEGPGEICCPFLEICEVPDSNTGACGDPHMTGFRGQKFDFTGQDGQWYCLLEDGPSLHLNMRVSTPVPSLPEITYITGLAIVTTDDEGIEHTIDISVTNPHSMDSACPVGVSPCLAEGALTVKLDGLESISSPGEVTLGPGVAVSAVNLPGACRSFGFETYWERKKLENASAGRRLDAIGFMQNMGDWVLGDPTATNKLECAEYVAAAGATLGGLFTHDSEHTSFQIVTPKASIRLSHGRLHQLPMRDPTGHFDLPEHLTWQMNVAIDHHDVSLDAVGVLGETVVPTLDDMGKPIMQGIHAIRGSQDDYRVGGPLEKDFARGHHHN